MSSLIVRKDGGAKSTFSLKETSQEFCVDQAHLRTCRLIIGIQLTQCQNNDTGAGQVSGTYLGFLLFLVQEEQRFEQLVQNINSWTVGAPSGTHPGQKI